MKIEIEIQERIRTVELLPGDADGQFQATLDGEPLDVQAFLLRPGVLSLMVEGRSYRVVREDDLPATNGGAAVLFAGGRYLYRVEDTRSLKARRGHGGGADGPRVIKASMPGRVVRVLAQPGEAVEAHQGVVVIEAMKMQNELKSPKAGIVVEMRVAHGDTVAAGDVLAVIN